MSKKIVAVGLGLVFLTIAGIALAGAFSDAERAADRFDDEVDDLKKMSVAETKKIVEAICDAEEAKRRSAGKNISARVKSKIKDEYDDLEDLMEDANKKLDKVLDDNSLAGKHAKASDLKKMVKKRWQTIEKMTRSLRGANHPVVSWMMKKGNEAHKSRQSSSYCDVSEFAVRSGRIDCLKAHGKTCKVIELKPKNKNAISKGEEQARRYARNLNEMGADFDKLKKQDSDFADCETFKVQVDCYTLCPDIDRDGTFRSTSVSWSTDC